MAVELLAPAGSVEALRAACIAGADAVYIGGNRYGARAYADNPDTAELLEAIRLMHRLGKKLYLTVNTLLKDQETEEVCAWMRPFYLEGVDAVIVQDLGVVRLFRENFPDMPVHASTQMAVTGPDGVRLLQELGICRVVPARELSLKELTAIRDETGIELETFIHGALCYSYSGQCLMSSLIGGRSGNRGRCAGICRLPFRPEKTGLRSGREIYPLNMKDLCTLHSLPELVEAGISSFKIEGRMKKPEYTAGVVSVYRRALDAVQSGTWQQYDRREDAALLAALYNRDGFTDGYYKKHNGADMIALKNEKLSGTRAAAAQRATEEIRKKLTEKEAESRLQMPVKGSLQVIAGRPASCVLTANLKKPGKSGRDKVSVRAESAIVETARTAPSSDEQIRVPFLKTGGSSCRIEELRTDVGNNCFISAGALKELRRRALAELEEEVLKEYRRELRPSEELGRGSVRTYTDQTEDHMSPPALFASVLSKDQAEALLSLPEEISPDTVCLPAWLQDMTECFHKRHIRVFLAMPYVYRLEPGRQGINMTGLLTDGDWDGVLIRTLEEAGLLFRLRREGRAVPEDLILDATMYTMNQLAAETLAGWGFSGRTLPYELNFRELRRQHTAGSQLVVYGRYPMMISAQCVRKTTGHCTQRPGWTSLTDRTGSIFPVYCSCTDCCNVIYNSLPLSLMQELEAVRHLRCGSVRVDFTDEDPEMIRTVMRAVHDAFHQGKKINTELRTTRGHFRRGVE